MEASRELLHVEADRASPLARDIAAGAETGEQRAGFPRP